MSSNQTGPCLTEKYYWCKLWAAPGTKESPRKILSLSDISVKLESQLLRCRCPFFFPQSLMVAAHAKGTGSIPIRTNSMHEDMGDTRVVDSGTGTGTGCDFLQNLITYSHIWFLNLVTLSGMKFVPLTFPRIVLPKLEFLFTVGHRRQFGQNTRSIQGPWMMNSTVRRLSSSVPDSSILSNL